MKILNIFIVFLLTSSCQEPKPKTVFVENNLFLEKKLDTIKIFGASNLSCTCSDSLEGYYNRFGLLIQKYYNVIDSLSFNKGKVSKFFLVLSPVPIDNLSCYDCLDTKSSDRLLVEVEESEGQTKLLNIYSNLISNVASSVSTYNGINISKEGIQVSHQKGDRFSWEYTTFYILDEVNGLLLSRIERKCLFEDKEHISNYYYSNQMIDSISLHDTIKNNCGCDNVWNEWIK